MRQEKISTFESALSYMSNSFVLLILGSLITYFLVPSLQRKYEERQHRREIMTECLKEFSLAANLIYQEFFVIAVINIKTSLTDEEYIKINNDIKSVRARRFDAFARVKTLSVIFHDKESKNELDKYLEDYYNETYIIAGDIDIWVRTIYCGAGKCINYTNSKDDGPIGHKKYIAIQNKLESCREFQERVSRYIMQKLIE